MPEPDEAEAELVNPMDVPLDEHAEADEQAVRDTFAAANAMAEAEAERALEDPTDQEETP